MKIYCRFIAALVVLIAVAGFAGGASAAKARVTFVVVSDFYQMSEQRLGDGMMRGGFARLAAVVKAERAKGGSVIVAHAGDTLSPSLMSGFDHGRHVVALTNLIAPDIFVPGNHEFDFGKAIFLQRMSEAKFPLFAANLRGPDGQHVPGFKDRTILTVDGVRIGITAATYDETPRVSGSEDLRFAPSVETLKTQAAELRKEGADFVVAVVHAGRGQDYAIHATGVLDLILTGHDHDLFINYDERSAIVESSRDAHRVVVADVTIEVSERDGRRSMTWSPQFRIVDTAAVIPDPGVAAEVTKYEQDLTRELDVPVGVTAVELDSRNSTVRKSEAAIGNLFADAMRASVNADVGLTNGGGIRAGRVYAAGAQITRRAILEELPFGNRLVRVDVAGRDLKRAVEIGLRALPTAAGQFPQVSGLTIVADVSRPAGDRIIAIMVGGQPLDEARIYSVATSDYLARGGDGYDMLRGGKQLLPDGDAPLIANEVMAYVRNVGTVRTGVEGRIILK
ncbi:MAG: bifunctional UDP-sugar hydrolase/5'-nucleotidase [Hyphomicrobiaceae bacterium]